MAGIQYTEILQALPANRTQAAWSEGLVLNIEAAAEMREVIDGRRQARRSECPAVQVGPYFTPAQEQCIADMHSALDCIICISMLVVSDVPWMQPARMLDQQMPRAKTVRSTLIHLPCVFSSPVICVQTNSLVLKSPRQIPRRASWMSAVSALLRNSRI